MAARKLKVWIGNYDGDRQALVLASTKKLARATLKCALSEIDGYYGCVDADATAIARFKPATLYTRPIPSSGRSGGYDGWTEGRCEIKRK